MEPGKVLSIEGQNGSPIPNCNGEHLGIRDSSIALAGRMNREHLMTESDQLIHHGEGEVLVGIEPRHSHASSFSRISLSISSRCFAT